MSRAWAADKISDNGCARRITQSMSNWARSRLTVGNGKNDGELAGRTDDAVDRAFLSMSVYTWSKQPTPLTKNRTLLTNKASNEQQSNEQHGTSSGARHTTEPFLPVPKQPYSTENVSCVSITEMVEAEHVRGGSVNDVRSCSSRCSRKSRVSRLNRYDKYSRGSLYTLFSSSFILQSPASLSGQSIIVDITNRQLHHAIISNCIEPIAPVLARHLFAPS